MNLLLIDCNSVRSDEQKKASELSKFDDLRLSLLVPSYYVENYKKNKIQKTYDPDYRISVGFFFGKHPNRAVFLNKLLKEILNKPDIICVHSDENFFLTFQALLFKQIFSPKSKFIFHTWQNIYFNGKTFPQRNKILYYMDNLIEKFVLRFSDACITRNREALAIMNKKGIKGLLTYIPWGTDIDNFYKRDVTNVKKEYGLKGFVIGYIGRLVEEKGILDLLMAVKNVENNYTLLIIGDGPLKSKINLTAEKIGISKHLRLLDGIPFRDVPVMMNCLDILVLPSRTSKKWKEQFGRVLVEAMACEVPVIGSDSGAISDVIGDAGLIFREADISDLTSKLITLMKDEDLMKKLGKKARQRALEHFTWQMFAKRSYLFFKKISQETQGAI
jgi:glycosyltransferase involved in cell wall biosynthesis